MTLFSFEMYPPRTPAALEAVHETVTLLAATHPQFISVTYGASGSSRDASIDLLRHLRDVTDVTPLAHLTAVGSSEAELRVIVDELLGEGIRDFLALRGDPPAGLSERDLDPLLIMSSADLVRLIREQKAAAGIAADFGQIAVAAYPNGHERSTDRATDIAMLVEKQEAGADFAITQLFFEADDYLDFMQDARAAGLTIPVLPGLMPVSTPKQLIRIAELAGQEPPQDLLQRLEAAGSSAPEIGVEHTVQLGRKLLAGGAPSLHLYTFNKHESVLAVLQLLRLI